MDDLVTAGLLGSSAFFVALSLSLLVRYRQVSTRISSSNDLGHDLWEALEARMKRQDERILDMMGRFEVIQSRIIEERASSGGNEVGVVGFPPLARRGNRVSGDGVSQTVAEKSQGTLRQEDSSGEDQEFAKYMNVRLTKQDELLAEVVSRLESVQSRLLGSQMGIPSTPTTTRPGPRTQPRGMSVKVDEKVLITMIAESPRTSVEIRERFGITREHAARVLKELFDRQLVVRNDKHKPFVYELTEEGRRLLAP